MTNSDLFQKIFRIPASDVWSMTAERFVEWQKAEVKKMEAPMTDKDLEEAGFEL